MAQDKATNNEVVWRIATVTAGMLLAPLAIGLLYLKWWMLFSYIVFTLAHFLTLLGQGEIVFNEYKQYPKRGEFLYHAIVLVIDTIIACYPLFYLIADRYYQFRSYEVFYFGLYREDYSSGGLALVLMVIVVGILGLIAWNTINNVVHYRQHLDAILQDQEEQRQQVARQQAFMAMLENKYGTPDKTILIGSLGIEAYLSQVFFFTPKQHVVIAGEDFHFSQIVGCDIVQHFYEVPATVEQYTTSNTGEMLVRSLWGRALFGKKGYFIGAMTTPTKTEYRIVDPAHFSYNYEVFIHVRNSPDEQPHTLHFEHVAPVMAETLHRRILQITNDNRWQQTAMGIYSQ